MKLKTYICAVALTGSALGVGIGVAGQFVKQQDRTSLRVRNVMNGATNMSEIIDRYGSIEEFLFQEEDRRLRFPTKNRAEVGLALNKIGELNEKVSVIKWSGHGESPNDPRKDPTRNDLTDSTMEKAISDYLLLLWATSVSELPSLEVESQLNLLIKGEMNIVLIANPSNKAEYFKLLQEILLQRHDKKALPELLKVREKFRSTFEEQKHFTLDNDTVELFLQKMFEKPDQKSGKPNPSQKKKGNPKVWS